MEWTHGSLIRKVSFHIWGRVRKGINETNGKEIYATTSSSVDDIFKLFKFLADHSSSEWVIHKKGNRYVLGSLHDYSHPDVNPSIIDELESMGYWINLDGTLFAGGDYRNVVTGRDYRLFNYVYFPKSTRVYNVEKQKPRFIRTIGTDYRRFYFGTLNNH